MQRVFPDTTPGRRLWYTKLRVLAGRGQSLAFEPNAALQPQARVETKAGVFEMETPIFLCFGSSASQTRCWMWRSGGKPRPLMMRTWRRRGKPLVAKVPHGHRKTLTFLAAVRRDHRALCVGRRHQRRGLPCRCRADLRPHRQTRRRRRHGQSRLSQEQGNPKRHTRRRCARLRPAECVAYFRNAGYASI